MFIGLDLTTRDGLHDAWGKRGLWWRMLLLIGTGSMISYALNRNAGQIALASFVAFAAAGLVDAIVYQILRKQAWMIKVNGSNILAAVTDSVLFPTIAFGGFMPLVTVGQFAAKIGGGFIWSLLLQRMMAVREEQK